MHLSCRIAVVAAALVMLAGCGGSGKVSGSASNTNSASADVHVTGPNSVNVNLRSEHLPLLKAAGNGGKCSLSTGRTFRFAGRGFTPHGKVQLVVFAPPSYSDPVYTNQYNFYWFQQNFGVYRADAHGVLRTKPWDCRHGPGNKPDPAGSYTVRALDWKSGHTSRIVRFRDTP
jgi:hypothetical protein